MRHVDSQYVSANEQALSFQPAYWTGDVSLIFRPDSSKWSLTAYVKNVNDVAVKTSYYVNSSALAAPRTYGLVGNLKF